DPTPLPRRRNNPFR
ncbi:mgtA regulatory leader peptide MgtL, partial [Citrobacter freundii]